MISVESASSVVYHDGNVVPRPSVAKLSSASAMAHDSDTGQGDRNEKGKQKCLSASGNKKCVCHKKTCAKTKISPARLCAPFDVP